MGFKYSYGCNHCAVQYVLLLDRYLNSILVIEELIYCKTFSHLVECNSLIYLQIHTYQWPDGFRYRVSINIEVTLKQC